MRSWLSELSNLLYPSLCAACGEPLELGELKICTSCRWNMPLTDTWLAHENEITQMLAGRFSFEHACSYIYFSEGSDNYRLMIHRMKYDGRSDLARMTGEMFGYCLSQSPYYGDIDLLVPVPLHWSRRLWRGYNQSQELCRGMSAQMGVAYNFRALRRVRRTRQQAKQSSKGDRWKNVSGAFEVTLPKLLVGKHILLVDDVLTSGSTIESCAQVLVSAGCRVSIAVLAFAGTRVKST